MNPEYSEKDLPPKTITAHQKTWRREKFKTHGFQWIRELNSDEYDWNTDEVSLVGTDVPIRVVSLQFQGEKWTVEGSETAGPDYHRPGFTELISEEYSERFKHIRL